MVLFHRTWYYYGTIVLPVFLDMSEMVHVKKKERKETGKTVVWPNKMVLPKINVILPL